jgi:hypothetical protein
MAFTEFCCRSGGSNMNGGGLSTGAEPATTAVYSATNGGWNSGTGVFTPTSGDPSASVTVGDFAHVFTDGSTTPTFIGRVTAVNSTTITVSTTAKSGTAPGTSGTGISINVGGAWAGPSGAVGFPFNFITNAQVDASSNRPRVNFKNDATYSITAAMTHTVQGPTVFQGYTSTFGDLGRATIDGGTSGASYILLALSGSGVDCTLSDLIFQNNGATGSATGLDASSNRNIVTRCVVNSVRGHGFAGGNLIECEAYSCNQSNTANTAGFGMASGSGMWAYCISHDNSGSNSSGFYAQGGHATAIGCIADTNGAHGFNLNGITLPVVMIGCDAYNNAGSGLRKQGTSSCNLIVRNCNFVSNGAYGVDASGSTLGNEGYLWNCGFHNNTTATVNGLGPVVEVGSVTLGGVPYTDAANGDFRISLSAAKGTGRGTYTQTAASYTGTVGYPDIGAAQHQETAGSSGGRVIGG